MNEQSLKNFLLKKMKMTGPYQALVVLECLKNDGSATLSSIAEYLSAKDKESNSYYVNRLKVYPKQVLKNHQIAEIKKEYFVLTAQYDEQEKEELIRICEEKLHNWYMQNDKSSNPENKGWGALRYKLLTKYRKCLLCGAKPSSENDIELDIDHILPTSKGGKDEESNLQVLCSTCNRSKGNTDQTDFRPKDLVNGCIFCNLGERDLGIESKWFWIIRDNYPVTPLHTLIIPKSHLQSPTDMDLGHWKELGRLVGIVKKEIFELDSSVAGFNLGFNDGEAAGQTIFHAHFHVIPRRKNDVENPRGGIRGVILSQKYY
jgi:ATP adenylyltransferase